MYNYQPKSKNELIKLIRNLAKERGWDGNYNDIDTSCITDMGGLFLTMPLFNGDISDWDTSNVTCIKYMFASDRYFDKDISKWDLSNVEKGGMSCMFCKVTKPQSMRLLYSVNVI